MNSGFWKYETLAIVFLAAGGNRLIICSIQFPLNDDNLFPRFFSATFVFSHHFDCLRIALLLWYPSLIIPSLFVAICHIISSCFMYRNCFRLDLLRTATYLQLFLADPLKMCHMSTDDFSNCSGFSLWCLSLRMLFFLPFAKTFGPNFEKSYEL